LSLKKWHWTLVSPRDSKAFKDKIIFFGKAKALLPEIA